MRVVVGTDERTPVVDAIVGRLGELGAEVAELPVEDWPEAGRDVAAAVATGRADVGIVCCWTGTGVSIAANKVAGVRAALCTDAETARGARRWNDANVLAVGLRLTSTEVARELVDAFLTTAPDPAEASTIARVEAATAPTESR